METSYSLVSCEREKHRPGDLSCGRGPGVVLDLHSSPVPDTGQRTLQSSGLWPDLLCRWVMVKVGLEECMCVSACVYPSAINEAEHAFDGLSSTIEMLRRR